MPWPLSLAHPAAGRVALPHGLGAAHVGEGGDGEPSPCTT